MATIYTPPREITTKLPDWMIDFFGRLRTSGAVIQQQINQSKIANSLQVTEGQVSGNNTSSTPNFNTSNTTLIVGSTDGLRRMRSKTAGVYQSGKSLLILMSFNFTDVNSQLSVVLRSSTTGTSVDNLIPQSNWNQDKFDGTGASGYNLLTNKSQILWIALEWLGVGEWGLGFIVNRQPYLAHLSQNFNNLDDTYMRQANLFLQYEIQKISNNITRRVGYFDDNDGIFLQGSGNSTSTLKAGCGVIINEGEIDKTGTHYSISRTLSNTYNTGTAYTVRPILLFRLNPSNINSRVIVSKIEVGVDANSNFYIYICRLPNISPSITPVWQSLPNRSIQYDNNPPVTTVTNANESNVWQSSGSASNTNAGTNFSFQIQSSDYLGSDFSGTPDIWALCIEISSSNSIVNSAIISFSEEL